MERGDQVASFSRMAVAMGSKWLGSTRAMWEHTPVSLLYSFSHSFEWTVDDDGDGERGGTIPMRMTAMTWPSPRHRDGVGVVWGACWMF